MDEDRELNGNESQQDSAKPTSIGDSELSDATEHGAAGGCLRLEGQPGDTGGQPDTRAALVWSLVLSVLKFERGTFERIGSDPTSTKPAIAVYGIACALPLLASAFQPDFLAEIVKLADNSALPSVVREFYRFLGGLDRSAALPLIMMGTFATGVGSLLVQILTLKLLFWFSVREAPAVRAWIAAFAFASAPNPLSAVPTVGSAAAMVYIALLEIVAIRELARVSISGAVLYWIGMFLLPGIVIAAVVLVYAAAAASTGL